MRNNTYLGQCPQCYNDVFNLRFCPYPKCGYDTWEYTKGLSERSELRKTLGARYDTYEPGKILSKIARKQPAQ